MDRVFGDRFYIELQRLGRPEKRLHRPRSLTSSRRRRAVVATNDVRFLKADDSNRTRRVFVFMTGAARRFGQATRYSHQQYLRTRRKWRRCRGRA